MTRTGAPDKLATEWPAIPSSPGRVVDISRRRGEAARPPRAWALGPPVILDAFLTCARLILSSAFSRMSRRLQVCTDDVGNSCICRAPVCFVQSECGGPVRPMPMDGSPSVRAGSGSGPRCRRRRGVCAVRRSSYRGRARLGAPSSTNGRVRARQDRHGPSHAEHAGETATRSGLARDPEGSVRDSWHAKPVGRVAPHHHSRHDGGIPGSGRRFHGAIRGRHHEQGHRFEPESQVGRR